MSQETIDWSDFEKIDLRVGCIRKVDDFPQARKPAYILEVDFGTELGRRKSSAQITELYSKEDLLGKLVVAVVNLAPKQIGPLMSECLITGFADSEGAVVLCTPDSSVPLGSKLY